MSRKRARTEFEDHYELLRLAENFDLKALQARADDIFKRLESLPTPPKGWDDQLPTWIGLEDERGLKSWGSRNYKEKSIKNSWREVAICRAIIQKAITFYAKEIGVPPVVTGVRPSKKKRTQKKSAARGGTGHASYLRVLVSARAGDPEYDMLRVFIVVIHAWYCVHLTPAVPVDSGGSDAIMIALTKDRVQKRLLASVSRP